ncbi:yjeF-like protein, hydroxyethylthiazole kinase-related protein [Candidatus Halobonum tyrrellensis G22]|uniref:YjeF-like protein, hydroxyethylthiazole kinase-related protein n=1 Tax=Candidatus Halobonum tyrrellensis G22 TaxID=1324957 RepID=V4HHP9_9EURY|nr:yjeF-like protein, hydroxyethylthiazole kinase-related protein [Candidatus Halobonum tyrrellensis G22]
MQALVVGPTRGPPVGTPRSRRFRRRLPSARAGPPGACRADRISRGAAPSFRAARKGGPGSNGPAPRERSGGPPLAPGAVRTAGAWIVGKAGELATTETGTGVLATDVIGRIPGAVRERRSEPLAGAGRTLFVRPPESDA